MCVVFNSTGCEFHNVGQRLQSSVDPCELSVFEEQQVTKALVTLKSSIKRLFKRRSYKQKSISYLKTKQPLGHTRKANKW